MSDDQSAPSNTLNSHALLRGASAVWSSIESLADFVADLFGVTVPLYEIYLDDALEYQNSLEQLQPILPTTVQYEPRSVDWEFNNS